MRFIAALGHILDVIGGHMIAIYAVIAGILGLIMILLFLLWLLSRRRQDLMTRSVFVKFLNSRTLDIIFLIGVFLVPLNYAWYPTTYNLIVLILFFLGNALRWLLLSWLYRKRRLVS